MATQISPKSFWENKVLEWERRRYFKPSSLIGQWRFRLSQSVAERQRLATQILQSRVAGKVVVELGCGSGLMAAAVLGAGATRYIGYDIAENAVALAREQARQNGLDSRAEFHACDIRELPTLNADFVFSLGLLDWLNDEEIAQILEKSKTSEFLHSFSEKRNSLSQILHRIYVHALYGRKTKRYVPRYMSVAQLSTLFPASLRQRLHVFRNRRLSFGAFLSSSAIEI